MKNTIRFLTTCVVLLLTSFTGRAGVTATNITYGCKERLMEFCLAGSQIMQVDVYQDFDDGTEITVDFQVHLINFSDETSLQNYYQQILNEVARSTLTSTNAQIRRDLPFSIYALTFTQDWEDQIELIYLVNGTNYNFNLIRSGDKWILPDLSNRQMTFYSTIPLHFPKLEWGRVEGYSADWSDLLYEDDSRYNPGENILPDYNMIQIPVDLLLSGTNGPSRLKVYAVTGTNYEYQIWGPMGDPFPKKPIWLEELSKQITSVQKEGVTTNNIVSGIKFSIAGGDPGIQLALQSTSALDSPWTNIGPVLEVSDFSTPISVTTTNVSGTSGFFRTLIVPGIPY